MPPPLGRGLLRLVAAMVPFVVGQGLGNLFRGQLAAAKMQNIVCDGRVGFGRFHGFLLFKGGRAETGRAGSLPLYSIVPFGKDEQNLLCLGSMGQL